MAEVCKIGPMDGSDLDLADHTRFYVYVPDTKDVPQSKIVANRVGGGRNLASLSFPGPDKNFRIYLMRPEVHEIEGDEDSPMVADIVGMNADIKEISDALDLANLNAASQQTVGSPFYWQEGYGNEEEPSTVKRIILGWVSEPRTDKQGIYQGLRYVSVDLNLTA